MTFLQLICVLLRQSRLCNSKYRIEFPLTLKRTKVASDPNIFTRTYDSLPLTSMQAKDDMEIDKDFTKRRTMTVAHLKLKEKTEAESSDKVGAIVDI